MERTAAKGTEDEQIKRAGEELGVGWRFGSHVQTIYSLDRGRSQEGTLIS
jgi:hypothetical protein